MNWSNNGERVSVRESGAIEFTEDLTDVKTLADGAYLTLRHTIDGVSHEVEIRSSNSTITRTYSIDGRIRPWDDEARRWLASQLPKLVRQSGIGAEARPRQILAAREAMLKEGLFQLRDAIDRYYADKGRYPAALDSLVSNGYVRKIPKDPFTDSTETWQIVPSASDPSHPTAAPGIHDVKSGSDATALDGSKYSDW